MSIRQRLVALAVAICVGSSASMVAPAAQEGIPHPDQYFGRTIGAPGVLIPHARILEFYEMLAERSDRVRLVQLGETTLGRPFYYALVSAPENLQRIDELLADNDRLYDPRGLSDEEAERIIRDGKTIVIVNEQIHSTEVGVSQGGLLLAHRLAAGQDSEVRDILDDVVIAHVPVHNPDGQEMVYEWLDRQRGTPYQNSTPPFLYHHYVGHDNNRDWYMFTQVETRLSIQMQNLFHPQFTLDQHQQGSNGSRIFVPPFEDPWEPNVDSALIASNNMIGTFMGQYLTARGYRGVEWKQRYDAWTPARAYYHSHGGVRILTEVASADYADDLEVPFDRIGSAHRERHWYFPMPWPGGTWSFAEVVDYHYASAMAALRAAADLRPHLLRGMLAAQRRSVSPPAGSPQAFVLPADQVDPPSAAKLLEVMAIADVEMFEATEPFAAAGREYDAGTVVIPFAQPAGRFARSVLERQDYPQMYLYEGGPIDPPYDVTAHTLPLMMNVRVDRIDGEVAAALAPIDEVPRPQGGLVGATGATIAYLMDPRVTHTFTVAAQLAGDGLARALKPFHAAGREWPPGTWLYLVPRGGRGVTATQELARMAAEVGVGAWALDELPEVETGWVAPPRVAIYQSYVPSMPEGWTRFVLEQYGIPFDILRDADIRRGDLAAYGLIILPPGRGDAIVRGLPSEAGERQGRRVRPSPPEFAGGIGDEGVESLRRYVRDGGTLFTWEASTAFATRHLGAPDDLSRPLSRTEFNIPGSLLRARFDPQHPLAYGLAEEAAVFFWNSPFWEPGDATAVASWPQQDPLLSGWIQGQEAMAGKAALLDQSEGRGRIVMVGFSPEYRAQTHNTFKVLFNAAFLPREDRGLDSGDR